MFFLTRPTLEGNLLSLVSQSESPKTNTKPLRQMSELPLLINCTKKVARRFQSKFALAQFGRAAADRFDVRPEQQLQQQQQLQLQLLPLKRRNLPPAISSPFERERERERPRIARARNSVTRLACQPDENVSRDPKWARLSCKF